MSTYNPNAIPTNPLTELPSNGLTPIETDPTLMSENAPAVIASTFEPGSVRLNSRPSSGRPSSGKRLSRNAIAPMEDPEAGQSPPPPPYNESAAPSRQPANGDSPAEEKRAAVVVPSKAAGRGDEEPSDRRTCHSFRVFGFPLPVFFILGNEFCERFSYYGMKAILVMYFTAQGGDGLSLDDDSATVYYHAFSMLVYFTPLLGGIIADTWLGKFWTIVSLSLVYAAGNIVMSVTSLPGQTIAAGAIVGLLLIALGSGGIKPCVSSFGADQFGSSESDKKASSSFFSIFYFAINVGSLLSIFITPILRTKVHCFGSSNSCYPLAFGVPAALMLSALVLFLVGTTCYKRNPPQGNVIVKVFGCIFQAFVNKFKGRPGKKEGFLNRASDKYDEQFIDDVRTVLRVVLFFLPVPVFWVIIYLENLMD
jgi:MFS family permease